MSADSPYPIDPKTDLVLERVVDVPPERVWRAWTVPEQLEKWFTPRPYATVRCEIDLRPGGVFRNVIRSPEGEELPHVGCYLEVVPNLRLVWTTMLLPRFRPAPRSQGVPHFTAVIALEAQGKGTRYTAIAMHEDADNAKRHSDMGFHEGWGAALDQLVELGRTM